MGVEVVRFSSLVARTFKINFLFFSSPGKSLYSSKLIMIQIFLDSLWSFTKFRSLSLQGISLIMAFVPKI